jgi:hypothetical protein
MRFCASAPQANARSPLGSLCANYGRIDQPNADPGHHATQAKTYLRSDAHYFARVAKGGLADFILQHPVA